jgi:adenosylhomocysteine nucleosidase
MDKGLKYPLVVLISADIEWRVIRELFPQICAQDSPYGEWFTWSQSSSPEEIIFFHGGWGKIAAAGSTQYVIDRWEPELLVNLGTCGGIAGEVEKGEIILVERTLVYDIIEKMGDFDEHIAHYSTDLDLSWLDSSFSHPVKRTLLVSGDRDLLEEDLPMLKSKYGAVAGDWESGAIAWVAKRNHVRCLIIRAVSDVVGAGGSLAYGNLDYFLQGTREVMDGLVKLLFSWIEN